MITSDQLETAMAFIATSEIGELVSVDSNRCRVVIEEQVYPQLMLIKDTVTSSDVGRRVLVSFANQDRSNGVVVGVIA